jgi:hypothetical protein
MKTGRGRAPRLEPLGRIRGVDTMRVLVTIPHYYRDGDGEGRPTGYGHASLAGDPAPRLAALTACVTALHQNFGRAQRIIDQTTLRALSANSPGSCDLEVVICTTGPGHLVPRLNLPTGSFRHHPTDCSPPLLGFECHAVLSEGIGRYDLFAYLEDDLICRDPWFFAKLAWFVDQLGDQVLLQPNRYEVRSLGFVPKAYIDGDIARHLTAKYQDLDVTPELSSRVLGVSIRFCRPANPHAGCFFLNARQMARWAERPDFLDRDTGFIGPLESAATLGIMRTFRVYKPAVENASFFEIEHYGTGFISQLRLR